MGNICRIAALLTCILSLIIGCGTSKTDVKTKPEAVKSGDQSVKGEKSSDTVEVEIEDQVVERKWEEYARVKMGIRHMYEKDTITYPSRGVFKVWRKRVLPERMMDKEIISLDEIDCIKEKHRSLFIQVIRKNGTVDTFKKPVEEWSSAYPETAEESLMDRYCKEANKVK